MKNFEPQYNQLHLSLSEQIERNQGCNNIDNNLPRCPLCSGELKYKSRRTEASICKNCNRSYTNNSLNILLKKQSIEKKHIITATSLECPRCDNPNYRRCGHTNEGYKKYYCSKCNYQFSQTALNRHLKTKQEGFCRICIWCYSPVSKGGKNGSEVPNFICKSKSCNRHFTDQTQVTPPTPKCVFCGSANTIRRGIYKDAQQYKCKECNKVFGQHTRYTEPVNHICPSCESSNIVRAGILANGEHKYRCKNCYRYLTEKSINHISQKYYLSRLKVIKEAEAKSENQKTVNEYEKDIWNLEKLGLTTEITKAKRTKTIRFYWISQEWLKTLVKKYAKYSLSILSVSTVQSDTRNIGYFSDFIKEEYPLIIAKDINRDIIISYLSWLKSKNFRTQNNILSGLKSFFDWCNNEEPEDFPRTLIFPGDFPKKREKVLPRYIPEEVMQQLNACINELPEPIMRMLIILQECGMRISELILLKYDCLLQDSQKDYFIKYKQYKMKTEISKPITQECAAVIKEQQEYIKKYVIDNLDGGFQYLFCARESTHDGNLFIPIPKTISSASFIRPIKILAREKKIKDSSGKAWNFQAHQFRHTVATRMINNGVPLHIVQRYLGHESPTMTMEYAHIHDQTMKREFAEFQGKLVDVTGKVVENNNLEADNLEAQWLKKNIMAQALPNGLCALPAKIGSCPHANACLTCTHFRTSIDYLESHKKQLEETEKIVETAKEKGWQRQLEMNEKVADNLRNIINGIEEVS